MSLITMNTIYYTFFAKNNINTYLNLTTIVYVYIIQTKLTQIEKIVYFKHSNIY